MHSPVRNFDFFRVAHAKEAVDLSPTKIREWAKREAKPDAPKIRLYRMTEDDVTWARFSEVEAFILANSKVQEAA